MKMKKTSILLLGLILSFTACTDDKGASKSTAPDMKCGAGKCGANMFDGKGALAKKKKNILSQMRENDPRKECVITAKTAKEAYACVKHKETNKMSTKCGTQKCGPGKCGDALTHEKMMRENPVEKEPAMKCGAGKCGGDM